MTKPRNPSDHYRREIERRAKQARPESELMAAARREYEAMLEAQATKGKGGRPKKKAAAKKAADDLDLEADDEESPGEEVVEAEEEANEE
jgi:hypothetical protein